MGLSPRLAEGVGQNVTTQRYLKSILSIKQREKEFEMNRALKTGTIASIMVFVVVCFGTVAAQDVIVKQGTIGTGNVSPSEKAKVFVSDGPEDTYYEDYGLLTVTTPTAGTENNYGILCEFFPQASDTENYGKVAAWFFDYPVGTEQLDDKTYYSLYAGTAGKDAGYTTNSKNVWLVGAGAGVNNPNNVAGGAYETMGIFAMARPVDSGKVMSGALSFANYGIRASATLDGSYQATSGSGKNFGAYLQTWDELDGNATATINSYALYLKPFTSNNHLHGGQTYGIYQEGSGVMNYFEGNISAAQVIDRTPAYSGTAQNALTEVLNIKSAKGEIDHSSLPALAKATVHRVDKTNVRVVERTDPAGNVIKDEQYDVNVVEEEGRSLGGMITVLTEAVKGLNEKVEALAAENQVLKAEIAALKPTATTP